LAFYSNKWEILKKPLSSQGREGLDLPRYHLDFHNEEDKTNLTSFSILKKQYALLLCHYSLNAVACS